MTGERPKYPGRCMRCGQLVDKSQITRHLKKCADKNGAAGGTEMKLYHLVVQGRRLPMYWLHLEIPGGMTLATLDAFLREIWLECCGHLSCFTIDGQCYSMQPVRDAWAGAQEKTMEQKIYSVLSLGTAFEHEYDYGSTTELELRVVDMRKASVSKPDVTLLARNEPPPWKCAECGMPATQIQSTGWGLDIESLLCDKCVGGDEEEGYLPVVNSPRVGVCGYSG